MNKKKWLNLASMYAIIYTVITLLNSVLYLQLARAGQGHHPLDWLCRLYAVYQPAGQAHVAPVCGCVCAVPIIDLWIRLVQRATGGIGEVGI